MPSIRASRPARRAGKPPPLNSPRPEPAMASHTLRDRLYAPPVAAVWRGFVGAAALALCYQFIHWSRIVDPRVLPSVVDILREMGRLTVDPEYLQAAVDTLAPALFGLVIACALAIPLGLLLGMSPLANKVSRGLIDILR